MPEVVGDVDQVFELLDILNEKVSATIADLASMEADYEESGAGEKVGDGPCRARKGGIE